MIRISLQHIFSKNWPAIALVGLLALALLVRVWGIWFGLPFVFHEDEDLEVVRALQLGSGSFDFNRIYKGGYFYLLFVEYGLLFVVLKGLGIVSTPGDFAAYYFRDPTAFYLIGRTTTAIIGAINVYLVFLIGRISYSARVGLIAALFLATNILHAKLSHYTTVDVPMACLATACLYFGIKILHDAGRANYLWAALFAALATATKITAVLVVVPLLASHVFAAASIGDKSFRAFFPRRLWEAMGVFVVVYAVTTPGIVLHFGGFMSFMLGKFGIGNADAVSNDAAAMMQETMLASTSLFHFYFNAVKDSMTWPVFAVCLAGMTYGAWRRKADDIVLIVYVLTFYVVMSMTSDTQEFFPRYMLPVIPVLAVIGARLVDAMARKTRQSAAAGVGAVLALVLSVLPVSQIVADDYWMAQKDTREIANDWFKQNVPEGATVFIEGTRTRPTESSIPLRNSAENVREMIEFYRTADPGKAKYFSIALKNTESPTYDLELVRMWDLRDLSYYKNAGVEYFVIRPENYEGSRRQHEWPRIVEQLRNDPDVELIKKFRPRHERAPGPYIEVYRVMRRD